MNGREQKETEKAEKVKIDWHIETRAIGDLKAHPKNPRALTKKGLADLEKSIGKFGLAEPLVVNVDGMVVGGHARWHVLKQQGVTECACYVPSRKLSQKECDELNIRLNANIAGEWDFDILANEWEPEELTEWGIDIQIPAIVGVDEDSSTAAEGLSRNECPKCGFKWNTRE